MAKKYESQFVALKNGLFVPARIKSGKSYMSDNIHDFTETSDEDLGKLELVATQPLSPVPYVLKTNQHTDWNLIKGMFQRMYEKIVDEAGELSDKYGTPYFAVMTSTQKNGGKPLVFSGSLMGELDYNQDLFLSKGRPDIILESPQTTFSTANFYNK